MTRYLMAATILLPFCVVRASDMPINAVLGDKSFVMAYGRLPTAFTNERLRIFTHLTYVEALLRSKDVSGFSSSALRNRLQMLNLLHRYAITGIFPVNHDYINQRRPCFMDSEGRVCAVGYLMQQTSGDAFVEQINTYHQYDYLPQINEPAVKRWASTMGLTIEECAMIQPQYNFDPPVYSHPTAAPIPGGYGLASGVFGGINIAASVINLTSRSTKSSRIISSLGLLTGATEVILGVVNIRKPTYVYYVNSSYPNKIIYRAQNHLSYANIAVGAATIATGVLHLRRKTPPDLHKGVFNVYALPGSVVSSPALGFTFRKTIG